MTGQVVLIGGGPGAADLITVRGLDRLLAADVVITDRLAPTALLGRLGPDVEVIDASRAPGQRTLTYDQVIELMIARAQEGKMVVRLKGGDPFVFAHGAQEVDACAAAGVAVEIVPGVTSAIAGPVLAGIPLTSTDGAAGFTVISGHLAPDDPRNRLDWTAIARSGTTVVVLMGMRTLSATTARLIADGVPPDTPSSCVADVSLPSQRVVRSTLDQLANAVAAAGLGHPAVVIVEAGAAPHLRQRVLVLGGSRSGKSRFAESKLSGAAHVDYIATAPGMQDAEWDQRIRCHQARRPASWQTIETGDVASHLARADAPVLIESVTAWLARAMDECACWDDVVPEVSSKQLEARIDRLCDAWGATSGPVIAVSDEVGGGIVPATASGRRFRDLLGLLNQRLAASADEVHLVTAGIARRLK